MFNVLLHRFSTFEISHFIIKSKSKQEKPENRHCTSVLLENENLLESRSSFLLSILFSTRISH